METSIDYTDYTVAVVSTDEPKWHRRLRAYKEQYPDQVRIKYQPETNDGNMVAEIPVCWVKIAPPRRVNLTDEEKAVRAERLRNSAGKRQQYREAKEDDED